MIETALETLIPPSPARGGGVVALLTLGIVFCLVAAPALERFRTRLAPSGLLPNATWLLAPALRALALLLGLGLLGAILPVSITRVAPWMTIAAALATGWTLRDPLQDVGAWLWITIEGRLKPGLHVRVGTHEGRIERLTPRAIWLVEPLNGRIAVPNRGLLTQAIHIRPPARHPLEVVLAIDGTFTEVHQTVTEALRRLPWAAPEPVELAPLPDGRWKARLQLLDPSFASRATALLTATALEHGEGTSSA